MNVTLKALDWVNRLFIDKIMHKLCFIGIKGGIGMYNEFVLTGMSMISWKKRLPPNSTNILFIRNSHKLKTSFSCVAPSASRFPLEKNKLFRESKQ
jgi:hypothetical protein